MTNVYPLVPIECMTRHDIGTEDWLGCERSILAVLARTLRRTVVNFAAILSPHLRCVQGSMPSESRQLGDVEWGEPYQV
jgi:hypothetical protein